MTPKELINHTTRGGLDSVLTCLYPHTDISAVRKRVCGLAESFEKSFCGNRELRLFSAPGRTEIGGNHTDHQRGRVLAAAVSLDVLCAASPNGENLIRICSDGYEGFEVGLDSLASRESEKNTSVALVRGIVNAIVARGYFVSGFDAQIASDVLKGSGLSSSAAFEVAIGAIISGLFCEGAIAPTELAIIGQYSENVYFGKPSGLMDQTASAVGGCVAIDFADPENPQIESVDCDFSESGYTLCIVDTKGSHADLTGEYAAIPAEMLSVANFFGKTHLRDVNESKFFARLPGVRKKCGDRAVLRAVHFFGDNARVIQQVKALKERDFEAFLRLVAESGRSSMSCLQNIYSCSSPKDQGLSLALALSDLLLCKQGACRVHGGGFAGTIQAFVPAELVNEYVNTIESVFGKGSCHRLSIRPNGATELM